MRSAFGLQTLLRQRILPVNVEMAADAWRSGVRLASSDADGVIPFRDHRIPFLGHHTQIARLQLEVHLLACARIEMNPFEAAKRDKRSTFDRREFEIEL